LNDDPLFFATRDKISWLTMILIVALAIIAINVENPFHQ
jgi:hypothetical protein